MANVRITQDSTSWGGSLLLKYWELVMRALKLKANIGAALISDKTDSIVPIHIFLLCLLQWIRLPTEKPYLLRGPGELVNLRVEGFSSLLA